MKISFKSGNVKQKIAADEADFAYQLLQENPDVSKFVITMLQKQSS